MQTTQARAIRICKRTTRLKYVSVILIISCLFTLPVFAAGTETDTLSGLKEILQSFISIMSRGWIILAALAGKMMSNDRVFGAALHMDVYLRKIWNIMKNFANFALIAFLLGSLVKNLLAKKDLQIKSLITKTLIAGVLIQASRFMMGALIDVSTVAVSAIGSFPVSFMQGNSDFRARMEDQAKIIRKTNIIVDARSSDKTVSVNNAGNDDAPNPMSESDILDSLMPDGNSLGGPLIFLGASVFRFYGYLTVDSQNTPEATVINFSLKTVVLVMYTIALLLLLIANIVRVAFLRIFIIASPFIVLFKVFKDGKMPGDGKGIAKYLSFSGLLDLVFKPVIFMAMMSLILILVVSVQNVMTSQSTLDLKGGVTVSTSSTTASSTLAIQGVSSVTINDNLFKTMGEGSKSIFVDLILFFLTIFLMRELVKFSLTSGEGPIQNVMKPITGFAENFLKSTPLFGLPSVTSIKKGFDDSRKNIAKASGMTTDGKFYEGEEALKSKINSLLGMQNDRGENDYDELRRIANAGDDSSGQKFFGASTTKAQEREGGLSLNNSRRRVLLEKWFEKNKSSLSIANGWHGSYTNLDDFLGKGTDTEDTRLNRKKLHALMGGRAASDNKTTTIGTPTYKQLMSMSYYKGSTTK